MMLQPLKSKRPSKQLIDSVVTRIAPVNGWNARDPQAAMKPGDALYLQNLWPQTTYIEVRKGAEDHSTGFGQPVKGLATYNGRDGTKTLWAATDLGIYNATASGAVGAAATAITNGRILSANFATTGASYLFVVNGTDSLRYWDGASWTVVASYSINGGGTLTTSNIVHLNVFKRMLFFIEKDSMSFFTLPIDSIAGNVSRFPLGGLFAKGGYLVAMGTWTVDGGQGVDDYAVFVTSEGQMAVYKGTDPTNANAWALQGVYDLSSPIGRKCLMKFGGDLLYLSRDGLFPLGKALQSTTLNFKVAVSDRISRVFSEFTFAYGSNAGWESIFSLTDGVLLVNVPTASFSTSVQFAMNTLNGSWCSFTGWDAFCWELMDNQLYMGMEGKVAKGWYGTSDFGGVIPAIGKAAFDYLGSRMSKHVKMLRPIIKVQGQVAVDVAMDVDFFDGTSYGPSVFTPGLGSLFDTALWVADPDSGPALWVGDPTPQLNWLTVASNPCFCAAPRLRILSKDATVQWSATDFAVESGGVLS